MENNKGLLTALLSICLVIAAVFFLKYNKSDIFPTDRHGYPLTDRIVINGTEFILSDKDITAEYYDILNEPKTVYYNVDFDYSSGEQLEILIPQGSVVNCWEAINPKDGSDVNILQTNGDHMIEGISTNVFKFNITGCEHGTVSIICYNIIEKDLTDKNIICQIDVTT